MDLTLLNAQPAANHTKAVAGWEDIDGNLSDVPFTVTVAGTYDILATLTLGSTYQAAVGNVKIIVDRGLPGEQTLGGDGRTQFYVPLGCTNRCNKTVSFALTLTAGGHTCTLQWDRSLKTIAVWTTSSFTVTGQLLSYLSDRITMLDAIPGTQSLGTVDWEDIDPALTEVPFTVTRGDRYELQLMTSGYVSIESSAYWTYRIVLDRGLPGETVIEDDDLFQCFSYWWSSGHGPSMSYVTSFAFANLSSGAHTATLQWKSNGGTSSVVMDSYNWVQLIARRTPDAQEIIQAYPAVPVGPADLAYHDIHASLTSVPFNLSISGDHILKLVCGLARNSSSAVFRLLVDQGTPEEIVLQDEVRGFVEGASGTGKFDYRTVSFPAALTAGARTLTVQWRNGIAGVAPILSSVVPFQVLAELPPASLDLTAPVLTVISPVIDSSGNPQRPTVVVDIQDPDSGLKLSSVDLALNGTYAVLNGAAQTGFTVLIFDVPNGKRYIVTPDAAYPKGKYITVECYAEDNAEPPNVLSNTFQFRVLTDGGHMSITDLAGTVLAASTIKFISPGTWEKDIYSYLIQSIRDADQTEDGGGLLRRWLTGPQAEYEQIYVNAARLLELQDLDLTPDQALRHLVPVLGLDTAMSQIVGRLTADKLRALAKLAVRAWRTRGTDAGLQRTLRAFLGRQVLVLPWFRWRGIEGEVELGLPVTPGASAWLPRAPVSRVSAPPDVVAQVLTDRLRFELTSLLGTTPGVDRPVRVRSLEARLTRESFAHWDAVAEKYFCLTDYFGLAAPSGLPSSYHVGLDPDEYLIDVLVPDPDRTLDRELVAEICGVMRRVNERIYLRFPLLIETWRRAETWVAVSGTVVQDREAGTLTMSGAAAAECDEPGDHLWADVAVSARLTPESLVLNHWWEVRGRVQDESNLLAARLTPSGASAATLSLEKVAAGVRTVEVSVVLPAPRLEVESVLSLEVIQIAGSTRARALLDGRQLLAADVAGVPAAGHVGLACAAGQTLTCRYVQVDPNPMDFVRVGPEVPR